MRDLPVALDEAVTDGRYTDPDAYIDMDMIGMRQYCAENGIRLSELTEEEVKRFIRSPKDKAVM